MFGVRCSILNTEILKNRDFKSAHNMKMYERKYMSFYLFLYLPVVYLTKLSVDICHYKA